MNKLVSYSWLESFLYSRPQQVSIHDTLFTFNSIMSGVLQGSTLGPLLFLIYVNDLFLNSKCEMYADDMTIIVSGKNRAEVIESAKKELEIVSSWLTKHKLFVNPTKTKYMIFLTKPH